MPELRFCPRCAGALEVRPVDQPDVVHPVCASCGFVLWQNLKASVEALIVRHDTAGDEILLGCRAVDPKKGTWDAPGGFLNVGDTIASALVRECKRELGVDVEPGSLVGVYEEQFASGRIVVIVYECRAVGGEPRPGVAFIDEARWFPVRDVPPLTFRSIERAISDLRRRL